METASTARSKEIETCCGRLARETDARERGSEEGSRVGEGEGEEDKPWTLDRAASLVGARQD